MKAGVIPFVYENVSYKLAYATVNEPLQSLRTDLSFLHVNERNYFDTLAHQRRQQTYLSGRKAAKTAIDALYETDNPRDIEIASGVFKFPLVKCPDLPGSSISLSHCDTTAVALAFPEEFLFGVDIEIINKPDIQSLTDHIITADLQQFDQVTLSLETKYMLIWTMKEALSKVLKVGLTANFNMFEIEELAHKGSTFTAVFKNFYQYQVCATLIDDVACSVVYPRGTKIVWDDFFLSIAAQK